MAARVAAAVLAAGSGTRLGGPKADLVVGGVRLLDRAVDVAREAGCAPVFAVVREGTDAGGAVAVVNPEPERGMRSSLALAVEAAADALALAVLLVDMPGTSAGAVRAVVDAWRPGRIALGRYPTGRGHPTVMSSDDWRAALELAGPDEGARAFLAAHADRVDEVDVPGDPSDLDTPDDVDAWISRSRESPA